MAGRDDVIIKSTHRGLRYEDGRLTDVLAAGRYEPPRKRRFGRAPRVEIVLVDMREWEITIKGQEILTADKVALRVSVITQFRVTDPVAAMESVADYQDRPRFSPTATSCPRTRPPLRNSALSSNAEARLYIGFDKHADLKPAD